MQNAQNSQLGEIARTKDEIIEYFRQKLDEKIIEETNFKLIEKLIKNPQISIQEAQAIQSMATTWTSRTGLVFEVRLEKDSDICYLAKDDKLSFTNDPARLTHTLIIGDNYPALLNLLITYREKVKMIYIDPPYSKDKMGGYAQTNYQNALTRDNLLSMLKPRLYLAKSLLRDDGVIFCSIDDRNQAYVKCLFDEVFGEGNFICNFVWERTKTPARLSKNVSKTHEFILVYAKSNDFSMNKIQLNEEYVKKTYKNPDNDPRGLWRTAPLLGTQSSGNKRTTYTMPDGRQITGKWRCSEETFQRYIEENRLVYCENGAPNKKIFLNENEGQTTNTLLLNYGTNDSATNELKSLFGTAIFDFAKPTTLIKHLLKISTANNADSRERERERERFYA